MTAVPPVPFEELEVGDHLDQATRAAVTAVAQMLERSARSSAARDRDAAHALRNALHDHQQQTPPSSQRDPRRTSHRERQGGLHGVPVAADRTDTADPADTADGKDADGLGARARGYLAAAGDYYGEQDLEQGLEQDLGTGRPGVPAATSKDTSSPTPDSTTVVTAGTTADHAPDDTVTAGGSDDATPVEVATQAEVLELPEASERDEVSSSTPAPIDTPTITAERAGAGAGAGPGAGAGRVVDEVTGGVRPGASPEQARVSAHRVAWAWAIAMADVARDPRDADASTAAAELHEYARVRFGGLSLADATLRVQATPERTAQASARAGETGLVPVLVPADRANPDRGIAPRDAKSPEEAAHRRQAWALARRGWETTRPDLVDTIEREQGWNNRPTPQQWEWYWRQYDTPAARTVAVSTARAEELKWAVIGPPETTTGVDEAPATARDADGGASPALPPGAPSPTPATGPDAAPVAAAVPAASAAGGPPPQTGRDRGIAPSKAATPAEAERRREAWRAAEGTFTSGLPAGTSGADAHRAWQALSWQDKAPLYWRHYDTSPVPSTETAPTTGTAAGAAPAASTTSEAAGDRGEPVRTSSAEASSGPGTAGLPGIAEVPEVSRARVVELNTAAADWFAAQAGPGSRGRVYLQDRLGAEIVEASLPAAATGAVASSTDASAQPGAQSGTGSGPSSEQQWRLGYAPPKWTALVDHLRQGGAGDQELLAAGLARTSSRGTLIDAFRDRAMVGIRDRGGDVVGFIGRDLSQRANGVKYLNTAQTPAFRKGEHLLGLYEARQAPAAKITRTEGPFDAIAVTAAGGGQIAGVSPMGTALTPAQAVLLGGLADERGDDSARGRVWIATDADPAGRTAAARDFWTLREHTDGVDTRLLPLPAGSDPAQLWQEQPAALQTLLDVADAAPSAGIAVVDDVVARYRAGLATGDADAHEQVVAEFDQAMTGAADVDRRQVGHYLDQRLTDERTATATAQVSDVSVVGEDVVADETATDGALDHRLRVEGSRAGDERRGEEPRDTDSVDVTARTDLPPVHSATSTSAEPQVDAEVTVARGEAPADAAANGSGTYDRAESTRQDVAQDLELTGGTAGAAAASGVDEAVYARETAAAAFSRPTRGMLSEVADGRHRSASPAPSAPPPRATPGRTYRP